MPAQRMHADEIDVDIALAGRLVAGQFPRWAGLPPASVPSAGSDNALYRRGADKAVRLPGIHWAVADVAKEHRWLPRLGPLLPLPIPVSLGKGKPAHGCPWHWSVYRWLDGQNLTVDSITDAVTPATGRAQFVAALHRLDRTRGPAGRSRNDSARAGRRDPRCDSRLARNHRHRRVTAAWSAALRTPAWQPPPVWIHGDLAPGNLLCVIATQRRHRLRSYGAGRSGVRLDRRLESPAHHLARCVLLHPVG